MSRSSRLCAVVEPNGGPRPITIVFIVFAIVFGIGYIISSIFFGLGAAIWILGMLYQLLVSIFFLLSGQGNRNFGSSYTGRGGNSDNDDSSSDY